MGWNAVSERVIKARFKTKLHNLSVTLPPTNKKDYTQEEDLYKHLQTACERVKEIYLNGYR